MRFNTLQLPKDQGGRGLPSLDDYYKAAKLRHLVCWCNDEYSAKWKDFEQSQLELPLQVLLGDRNFQQTQLHKLNCLTKIPLEIWYKELRNSKIERQGRILRWVEYDLQFKPARLDLRFKQWSLQGITSFCLISTENGLESFQQLSHKYNLDKQDFFRYLQVRHYFNKNIRDIREEDTGSTIVQIFVDTYKKKVNKKIVSRIYSCLMSTKKHSTMYVKQKWEKEANITITEEEWLTMWRTQMTTTNSDSWREFTWKNIIRFFITPRIKKIQTGNQKVGECWRKCGNVMSDHFHIFWDCNIIHTYCQELNREINAIMGLNLEYNFKTMYLGISSLKIRRKDIYLFIILLATSKKAITRKWLK